MAISKGSIASAADYNALLGIPDGPSEPAISGNLPPYILDKKSIENTAIVPTNKTIEISQPRAAIGDFLLLSVTDSNPDFQVTDAVANGWILISRTDGDVNTNLKMSLYYRYAVATSATYSFTITDGIHTHVSITSWKNVHAVTPIAQSSISATTDDIAVTFGTTTANNTIASVVATGLTETAPRSVYFALDESGSMSNGNRTPLLKQSMINILDEIDNEIVNNGLVIDVGLVAFDDNIDHQFEFTGATTGNIATLKDFINNTYSPSGGTNFNAAINEAKDWFETSLTNPNIDRRVLVFVSDGAHNGGPITVPVVLQESVSVYGFNIEHNDRSDLSIIDNTPEDDIPLIRDNNVSRFTQVLSDAIFSRRFSPVQPLDPSFTTQASVIEQLIPSKSESAFWTQLYVADYIGASYTENYSRPVANGLKCTLGTIELAGKDATDITFPNFPASGVGFTSTPTGKFKGIYGVGFGDYGYGQTKFAFPNVTSGDIMDNDTFLNLHTAMETISQHQNTSLTNLVAADALEDGDIINAYDGSDNPNDSLVNLVTTLGTNRLNAPNNTLIENAFVLRSSEWGRLRNTVLRFQWTSTDQARYFFNTGGQLRVNFSHDNNITEGDKTWRNILSNKLGTLVIGANSMSLEGTASSDVIDPNFGYYNQTDEFTTIFQDNTVNSAKRAIYFSIDASGSITNTRKRTIQQSILNILDDLDEEITNNGLLVDIGMVFWNTGIVGSLERLSANSANIAEFRSFILNNYTIGGGTDFKASLSSVGTWFTTSLADSTIDERIFVFMTDGNHNTGSFTLSDIPSVLKTDVDVYAFNIELTNTSDTSKLDNTPDDGIPILRDNQVDVFTNTLRNTIFQEHYIVTMASRIPVVGENVQSVINGGIGNTLDISITYRDGTNDLISDGSTIKVDLLKSTEFLKNIQSPLICALKEL